LSEKFQIILLFIVLNFGALGIGSFLMNNGATSSWYLSLNKAPWTPPGWVFGVAWVSIMVCFSIYMAELILNARVKNHIYLLFSIQLVLNISWNYIFFNQHLAGLGFVVIVLLTFVVAFFLINYIGNIKFNTLWIVPYFIWLLLASSLNLYIVMYN